MSHVFISYSREEDQPYARKLADELRKHDIEVWIDDNVDYGARWWRTIVKQVRTCAAFVVIMTPESEESKWVEREILLAEDEDKPIFPLLLRGKGNPLLIGTEHANVTGGRMPPKAFYDSLRRILRVKPPPPPPPHANFEPELVRIPAGPFLMGSKKDEGHGSELPQHTVALSEYSIGKYPVTNVEYQVFVRDAGYTSPERWDGDTYPEGKGNHPVVYVSWENAAAYCQWLSEKTGKQYRLPTEAQWEKAARGDDGRVYPWGDGWDKSYLNSLESYKDEPDTSPVGQFSPQGDSPYSCADMTGNVWEWCADWFDAAEYKHRTSGDIEDPKGPREGENRVLRGGSFSNGDLFTRCAARSRTKPGRHSSHIGFRVVMLP